MLAEQGSKKTLYRRKHVTDHAACVTRTSDVDQTAFTDKPSHAQKPTTAASVRDLLGAHECTWPTVCHR